MNIQQKFHLLPVGLAFLVFTLTILTDTYDYFIKDRFYEGYVVAVQIVVFDFIGLLLMIPFLIKKDFKNLRIVGIFYAITSVVGFQTFSISLAALPIILAGASFWTFRLAFIRDK